MNNHISRYAPASFHFSFFSWQVTDLVVSNFPVLAWNIGGFLKMPHTPGKRKFTNGALLSRENLCGGWYYWLITFPIITQLLFTVGSYSLQLPLQSKLNSTFLPKKSLHRFLLINNDLRSKNITFISHEYHTLLQIHFFCPARSAFINLNAQFLPSFVLRRRSEWHLD